LPSSVTNIRSPVSAVPVKLPTDRLFHPERNSLTMVVGIKAENACQSASKPLWSERSGSLGVTSSSGCSGKRTGPSGPVAPPGRGWPTLPPHQRRSARRSGYRREVRRPGGGDARLLRGVSAFGRRCRRLCDKHRAQPRHAGQCRDGDRCGVIRAAPRGAGDRHEVLRLASRAVQDAIRSPNPRISPTRRCGRRASRVARSKPSTSPRATISAGRICDRSSPPPSMCRPAIRRRSVSRHTWRTRHRCGGP
jgi:hypothetical protein